jgi:alkylation response protein AidB-like acyl-CoA dehydrogenase
VSVAKSYVGDHGVKIMQECIQMHGGMGVTYEHDAHLYLRRATQNRVLYGTPSDHRERIASRIGLGPADGSEREVAK